MKCYNITQLHQPMGIGLTRSAILHSYCHCTIHRVPTPIVLVNWIEFENVEQYLLALVFTNCREISRRNSSPWYSLKHCIAFPASIQPLYCTKCISALLSNTLDCERGLVNNYAPCELKMLMYQCTFQCRSFNSQYKLLTLIHSVRSPFCSQLVNSIGQVSKYMDQLLSVS